MQTTLTFPTMSSPHHRFTFSQSYDTDTDFAERCSQGSTPFVSAPSSPGRHCNGGFYFSAPASPHWAYAFAEGMARDYPSSIPLHWDEKPATPRRRSNVKDEAGSFLMTSDFEFSARFTELDDPSMSPTPMSSANELFCNGQIKPLKIPTRIEYPYPSCPTSRINIDNDEEHVSSRIDITEHAFEFQSRGVPLPTSAMSVSHSPRFASVFDCVGASTCGIYQGRSASSLSAPQSPHSPINRVKGALCGVSPSRLDRACDTSMPMPIEISLHALHSSNRINKPFDASMHMSRHSLEGSRHAREGSRKSDRASALGSQATCHRRTRSFSPLRIFQRGEHQSSLSSMGVMPQDDTTGALSRESRESSLESEKKHDDDANSVPKSLHRKWTLKDLLHRKSGGENRSNSSRLSSTRRSGASVDSTSGKSATSGGRSSTSESFHSAMSACNTCAYTKGGSISKVSTCNTYTHTKEGASKGRMLEGNENKKGVKQGVCEGKDSSKSNKGSMTKAKSLTCQRGLCVQKGNNNKGCVSPHEMHYMMHKAQSEELRKRTFLPYRQGLLGCLGFTSRSYRTVSSLSKTLQSVSG